jgi:thiosulfate sulfurtransferase
MIKSNPTALNSYGSWLKYAQEIRRNHFLKKGSAMSTDKDFININELANWRAQDQAHTLLDVRRDIKRAADNDELSNTIWRNPANWLEWKDTITRGDPVVVYCAHGHELSQAMAACLRALGHDARYVSGGIEAWRKAGHDTQAIEALTA